MEELGSNGALADQERSLDSGWGQQIQSERRFEVKAVDQLPILVYPEVLEWSEDLE